MADPLLHFARMLPAATPTEMFAKLRRLSAEIVPVALFTCSQFDLPAGQAERIFTSDLVLDKKQVFLSESIEDLRDVFPDHENIKAMGLGAALNIPIFVAGGFIGTVNLLAPDHSYSDATLTRLNLITKCALDHQMRIGVFRNVHESRAMILELLN